MSTTFDRMRQAFPAKDYRHTYVNGLVDSKLATQLKVLREQRGWTQAQLAEKCGTQWARISVLEDVNYSSGSISTLRRIGKAFDLWLDVEWKELGELPLTLQNMSRETLERDSFDDDPVFHESELASAEPQLSVTQEDNPFSTGSIRTTTTVQRRVTINLSILFNEYENQQGFTRTGNIPLLVLVPSDNNPRAAEAVVDTAANPRGEITYDGTAA